MHHSKKQATSMKWVDGFGGIGQLISTHDLYFEEFSSPTGEKKYNIGEKYFSVAIYKIFCDYEGKIRRRSHIQSCNADYCRTISQDSMTLVNKIKCNHPEDYEKFTKIKPKKPLGKWVDIWLSFPDEVVEDYANKIFNMHKKLRETFTYPEYCQEFKNLEIESDGKSPHQLSRYGSNRIIISLFNADFKIKEKRMVFRKANCTLKNA